jgi:hypothetical protein
MNNLQFSAALMITGLDNGPPLPLDLTFLGAPGCFLNVSPDLLDFVVGAGNTATWTLSIPNTGSLSGAMFYQQAAPLDTINASGFVASDAAGMIVGS